MAKKKTSNLKLIVLSVLALIAIFGAIFGYHFYTYIYAPNVKLNKDTVVLTIRSESNYQNVLNQLQEEHIIKNAESFDWVAQRKNYPNKVKAGKYHIQNGWSNVQLVDLLRSGAQTPIQVTFNNIKRLEQLAQIISKQIEPDSTALMNAFLNVDLLDKYGFTKQTVGAIFIPNTYEMYWNISAEQFVTRMQNEFDHFWDKSNKEKAAHIKLTPVEVTTLASIVEAETKKRDEMPKVAGLYLNRLFMGMKLQSDPTVVFALNKPNVHRVYLDDLKIDSPYNTYKHVGLPPGPIGFPSKQALNAVLNYHKSKYIYMCAKPDYSGYHNFASNYNQHLRNRKKYTAFLRAEGIR